MSRFHKLSQTLWCCQYHIVWVPKYRFRIRDVSDFIHAFSEQQGCEIVELNVQIDHVHLLVMVPPKLSISEYVGKIKGRSAIRILNKHRKLRQKPYWGNHFLAKGYCVDTVGLDADKIRKYLKYQEAQEKRVEQQRLF